MPVLLVAGTEQGAGATTVAVGLAHRITHAGRAVRVERLTGDPRAEADAQLYGTLDFAESGGKPLTEQALAAAPASGDAVLLVEASPGVDLGALAARLSARTLLVAPEGAEAAPPAGGGLLWTRVRAGSTGPDGALGLPEDRLLAAPTVGRLIEASGARVLARSRDGDAAIVERILVGAVSHDSTDVSYFERHPRTAVVTRAEKVDIALGALRSGAICLILSGGSDPSPYLLDRVASSRETTLLLAPEGTVETMRDIEGTFASTPLAGDAKVERVAELMDAAVDDAALARLLGG
jgi:BioD-like phosphotransacetylase family protein